MPPSVRNMDNPTSSRDARSKSHPYSRKRSAEGASSSSLVPVVADIEASELETSSGKKSRRHKSRSRDVSAVLAPHVSHTTETRVKKSSKHRESRDEILHRIKGSSSSTQKASVARKDDIQPFSSNIHPSASLNEGVVVAPLSSEKKKKREKSDLLFKQQIFELEEKLKTAEEAVIKVEAEMKEKVEALERNINETKTKLEGQTKLLADRETNHELIKEALTCGVCFECLDDPHVLSCGHTACKKCLVQWFRSPNAYRAEDVSTVNLDDDLSYRTKLCHLCREPVLNRPVRMFLVQSILDTLVLGDVHPILIQHQIPGGARPDPWANTFPVERQRYLLYDEGDDVDRCPNCLCEVDGGECVSCGLAYTDDGNDFDYMNSDSEGESILSDNIMGDHENEDENDPLFGPLREFYGFLHGNRDQSQGDHNSRLPIPPPPQTIRASGPEASSAPNWIDDMADESDDGESDDNSESVGSGASSNSHAGSTSETGSDDNVPSPLDLDREVRAASHDDDFGDSEYESSFINDSVEDEQSRIDTAATSDSEGQVEDVADGEDKSDEEDAPPLEILRRRRAERYAARDGGDEDSEHFIQRRRVRIP